MSVVELYSEKLGSTVTVQTTQTEKSEEYVRQGNHSGIFMMGWMKTGWSKSSSW